MKKRTANKDGLTGILPELVLVLGAVGLGYYVVFWFLPPKAEPYQWGGGNAVPDDTDYQLAEILHMVMRDCWGRFSVVDFFDDNRALFQSNEDIDALANAFGSKPYDWCLYELNLPDFIYPDLSLFQWIHKSTNEQERGALNSIWNGTNITYRI